MPSPPPLPIVLWHGMGDSADSPGMQRAADELAAATGAFVYLLSIAEDDRRASFFGRVDDQVAVACEQLREVPELAAGFHAVGFSQGGQFLRAYAERCNDPPVKTLVTFGAQHMGVAALPGCPEDDPGFACSVARTIAARAVYSNYVQDRIVQAQYFKDPARYQEYLDSVAFLPDINNERPIRNETYKKNFEKLEKLVLIMFEDDITVIPRESAWFGYFRVDEGDGSSVSIAAQPVIPMRSQPIYLEDWIGLRALDARDAIAFETCPGEHMRIPEDYLAEIAGKYLGGNGSRDRGVAGAVRVLEIGERKGKVLIQGS